MRVCGIRIYISPLMMIYFSILVFLLPLRWLAAFLIASAIHEMGHLVSIALMKIPVTRIRIDLFGMRMDVKSMSYLQELISSAAGPAAAMLLMGCGRIFPELALCAFFQSVYNLLPIYPADGGRILRSAWQLVFAKRKTACIEP